MFSCKARDLPAKQPRRPEGENSCRQQPLRWLGERRRVQAQHGEKRSAGSLPAPSHHFAPVARVREYGLQERGGLAMARSLIPARIAKNMAAAGCMTSRKLVGPSHRPTRFFRPRLSVSSIKGLTSVN
jgi:hypothetical protein